MKYQVTVTQDEAKDNAYRDDTIFKQRFEELDLAALAIFLNTPKGEIVISPFTLDHLSREYPGTLDVDEPVSDSPFGPEGTVAKHGFQKEVTP